MMMTTSTERPLSIGFGVEAEAFHRGGTRTLKRAFSTRNSNRSLKKEQRPALRASVPHTAVRLSLGRRRHTFEHLTRQVRHLPDHALEHHELTAMVHLVFFGDMSISKRVLAAGCR